MLMLVLTPAQAGQIKGETEEGAALAPRKMPAGPQAGKWALPIDVLTDPAHEMRREALSAYPQEEIDPDAAWPGDC